MIEGTLYDGLRSRGWPARVELGDDGRLRVHRAHPPGELDASETPSVEVLDLGSVGISDRVGQIMRRLELPEIGTFETLDNDGVDRLLADAGRGRGLVPWLEDRWPVAVASLALVAAATFLFIRFGIPAAAEAAARSLPPSVERTVGSRALALLDEALFEPSKLTSVRQMHLTQRFLELTQEIGSDAAYRFELRDSAAIGPNAFALPSGIIVMTDALVELAEHDEELVAVLAHELGHVEHRHSLRMLLQSAGVSAIAAALIGDVGSASAVLGLLPVLVDAEHSRDFEREADAHARALLARRGIDPGRFDAILCRMTAEADGYEDGLSQFLASHPPTDERARCPSRESTNASPPRSTPPPTRAARGS